MIRLRLRSSFALAVAGWGGWRGAGSRTARRCRHLRRRRRNRRIGPPRLRCASATVPKGSTPGDERPRSYPTPEEAFVLASGLSDDGAWEHPMHGDKVVAIPSGFALLAGGLVTSGNYRWRPRGGDHSKVEMPYHTSSTRNL